MYAISSFFSIKKEADNLIMHCLFLICYCYSVSLEGRDLVEKLMTKDPSKRINARKALEHPWLTRRALRMRQTTPQENQTDQSTDVTDFACTIS